MQTTNIADWLVYTKLSPPTMRDDVISRHRLVQKLQQAVTSSKLTLISAPAGYSKTTLLASWQASAPTLPVAWLSLDEGDNGLALFLGYMNAVLQILDADFVASPMQPVPTSKDQARHGIGALVNLADEERVTWRYHNFFARFIKQRLLHEMPELDCRAAQAETQPTRAIAHHLAAEMWEPAAWTIHLSWAITGIVSSTRAYTLTGLTNYVWYTVTLNGMLGSASFLADTVRVKPTDVFVYLPLVLRGYGP
ncbi:MAG: hypothetical protein SXV54_00110 [Chloroflexota bacterium]|nr:hypothetical protein [Chloroflexota bacterium]